MIGSWRKWHKEIYYLYSSYNNIGHNITEDERGGKYGVYKVQ